MGISHFVWAAAVVLVTALFSNALVASEPSCITAIIGGFDASVEKAIREQLDNEMGLPVLDETTPNGCGRLTIVAGDSSVMISLLGSRVFETELRLDEVSPVLRPRAIALSAAGLLMLSRNPGPREPPQASETSETAQPAEPTREPRPADAEPPSRESQASSPGVLSKQVEPSKRIRLHLLTGGHLVPKLRNWVTALLPGLGVRVGDFHLDGSFIGLFGRKSVDQGRIYSAGVGLRLAAWWQPLRRSRVTLGTGPAAELIGLFGYGGTNDGVTAQRASAPVLDILWLLGGWFALSRQTNVCVAVGGGWTPLHFQMKADGDIVSGLDGAIATFMLGIDYGV